MLSKIHTDVMKGIAILIIVIAHVGNFSGVRYFTPLGGIGVALFLICSGYGLYKSYEENGLEGFFQKRLSRVLLPYWIAVVIFYMIHPSELNVVDFVSNVLLISIPVSYWWFIQYILILYIAFYAVYRFMPEDKRLLSLGVLSILFFLLVSKALWGQQSFSFIIGIGLAKNIKNDLTTRKAFIVGGSALVMGILCLLIKQIPVIRNSNYHVLSMNQIILNLGIAIGIMCLTYPLLRLAIIKIFSVVGLASYEIYLVHTLVIFIVIDNFSIVNIATYIVVCSFIVCLFYYTNKTVFKPNKTISKSQ